jgi:hypothetical protein
MAVNRRRSGPLLDVSEHGRASVNCNGNRNWPNEKAILHRSACPLLAATTDPRVDVAKPARLNLVRRSQVRSICAHGFPLMYVRAYRAPRYWQSALMAGGVTARDGLLHDVGLVDPEHYARASAKGRRPAYARKIVHGRARALEHTRPGTGLAVRASPRRASARLITGSRACSLKTGS